MKTISSVMGTLLGSFALLFFLSQPIESAQKHHRISFQSALTLDQNTRLDCNSLEMFIYNDGNFAYDDANVLGKTDGLYYPRGTTHTVVYSAGIWVGAKVNGEVRLAISEYGTEFVPGPMLNGTFQPDHASFRVYKINRNDNDAINPDYANWPVDQGAPVDENGDPLILGDQITWSVFNDSDPSKHNNDAGSTLPLGLEIQHTGFGYNRNDPLSNVYFLKYKLINKGGNNLEDAYVSIWADPDLGSASDDLVGCDTMLSLGYCYNSGVDAVYGANPPAVGFDFFQGPIVPAEPTDSALVNGTWRHGFKNLGMTSFNKYINGTDPANSVETYGYMRGLVKDPISGQMVPMVNPLTGMQTKYAVSGNPVNQTGWIDAAAADRRLMLSTGPFNMAPGDTQEVVVAVLVGQGANPLSAIAALRDVDIKAQFAFDSMFDLPVPNREISVVARGRNQAVEVFWQSDMLGDIIYFNPFNQQFYFEGYNFYQAPTANGPWKKIGTFDVDNEVALIYGDVLNPENGAIERIVVQNGSNSGLSNYQFRMNDFFTGQPFENGETYYFGVSGYYYDVNHLTEFNDQYGNFLGYLTPTLETEIFKVDVTPNPEQGALTDTATHISGLSEGWVIIETIDKAAFTGHDYRITFTDNGTWDLIDLTMGLILLDNQTNQTGDYNYPVVDGFMPRVFGPEPGISGYSWIGDRWISGVDIGLPYFFGGLGNGANFFGSNVGRSDYKDVEIRWSFTATQKGHFYARSGAGLCGASYCYYGFFDVPFTAWDVSTNPERQLNVLIAEQYGNLCFDSTWLPCDETGTGREYLFVTNSTYTSTPNSNYTNKNLLNDASSMDVLYSLWPRVRPGHNPALELADGQMMVINASVPNGSSDIFEFSTGFECGDVNQSGDVNIVDAVGLINFIFGVDLDPINVADADVNCDGLIRITDCVYLINYIFLGGNAPCAACE